MIRRAFTMRLKPGGLEEYRRRHDAIWPELVTEIEKQGIARITIFENDPDLFLYSEIADPEAWNRLWASEIHDRWGEVMAPLMEFREDGVVASSEVREVFHLETAAGRGHGEGAGTQASPRVPANDPRPPGRR
jgi:L-rhamnose mutarotase